jgi:hypothetical protein
MPVNAMLAELDQDIAPRRAATNTDPDIATRHALGGHGAVPRPPTNAELDIATPSHGAVHVRSVRQA